MKKISFFLLLIISLVSISCKKSYTCGCAWNRYVQNPDLSGLDTIPYRQIYDINNSTENDAADKCLGYEIVIAQESDRFNINCTLREKD